MKHLYRSLFALVCSVLLITGVLAQNADQLKTERINASYLIAMGRKPNSGEITHWKKQGDLTVAQLVEHHRNYLAGDANMKRSLIIQAFKNSYGRAPIESEIKTNMTQKMTYAEWMINHINWLKKSTTDYTDVIKRAFKAVMGRDPQQAEINYYKSQPVMSYMVMAATLEDWKRQNGNKAKTSGTLTIGASSSYLSYVGVSATVASEASNIIGQASGNVIAAGGGNAVSAGGANVVAAGGGN